jgi:hypothetical protein
MDAGIKFFARHSGRAQRDPESVEESDANA